MSEDLIVVALTDEERYVLNYGLIDWNGPSECTESLAIAMGFTGLDDLEQESERIAASIMSGQPLTARDWTRALLSTEIIFASEVVGTGGEWRVIHGRDDAYWIQVLRRIQAKVPWSREFVES